jgi:eukaryotic-like serine/threonine-protein kinase
VIGLSIAIYMVAAAFKRERHARANAEASLADAKQAVELITKIAEADLPNHPMLQGVRQQMLEAALVYYQGFTNRHRENPALQAELAQSQARLKQIMNELTALQGAGLMRWILQRPIHEALNLSEAQKQSVEQLDQDTMEKMNQGDLRTATAEEKRRFFSRRAASYEQGIREILTTQQWARFRQIVLQQMGPMAFQEKDVTDKLQLTVEQKMRIRAIIDDVTQALMMRDFGKGVTGKGPKENWEPKEPKDFGKDFKDFKGPKGPRMFDNGFRQGVDSILEFLTPKQRDAFSQLLGPPYQGPPLLPPGTRRPE